MDVSQEKEVYFCQYCHQCEYSALTEDKSPCDECLASAVNVESHKPVNFKKKGN